MMTLDEAWAWFEATRSHLTLFARLGGRHWGAFPEDSPLWKDDAFKTLEPDAIARDSGFSLEHLNDFAVMVLFSVFEAIVRERVLEQVETQREGIDQELLIGLIDEGLRDLRKKGFYRVLNVFKSTDARLVEEVNQVRRYRNWVAHGRRATRPDAVDPLMAYRRLKRFLDVMTEA